jgi:hypothetical protein
VVDAFGAVNSLDEAKEQLATAWRKRIAEKRGLRLHSDQGRTERCRQSCQRNRWAAAILLLPDLVLGPVHKPPWFRQRPLG